MLYGEILAGSNSGNFTGNGAATVSMAWRNRTLQETTGQEGGTPSSPPLPAANSALISNVLNLTGMSTSGGEPVQTDPFVLQMNYDAALLGNEAEEAASGAIYLAWLNPNGGGSGVPLWQNAITGDTDGLTTPGIPIYLGSFLDYVNSLDGNANFPLFTTTYTTATLGNLSNAQLEEILGDWGVDTANHDVWAVIDHNSAFAVAAVPEPATLILAACGFVGLLGYGFRRRRRAHSRTVEHSVRATGAPVGGGKAARTQSPLERVAAGGFCWENKGMTTRVQQIADQVKALPIEERDEFLSWLAAFELGQTDASYVAAHPIDDADETHKR